MPTSVRLDPHAVSDGLSFAVVDLWDPTQEDLQIGREVLSSDSDEDARTTVYLTNPDLNWRELNIQFEAQMSASEISRVVPETSSPREDLALQVAVHCQATKLRRVTRLEMASPSRWRGDLRVRREEVRDFVRLVPRLVRTTDTTVEASVTSRVATYRGALVAEAPNVNLVLDERRRPEGVIRIRWEDFRSSDHPWRRAHASNIFQVDAQSERPTLWLNARHENLRAALKSRASSGGDAVIRHLLNGHLAQAVWTELVVVALGSADLPDEEGAVIEPTDGWKQAVLRRFLPRLFPDVPKDERLKQAVTQLHSPELIGSLALRLGSATQDVVALHSLAEKAIRAAEARDLRA